MTGIYQIAADQPWGFDLSGNIYGRQGFAIPYYNWTQGSRTEFTDRLRDISLVGKRIDRFRFDDLLTVDLRLEKTFAASSDVEFAFGVELFNALNEGVVLGRQMQLNSASGDWVQSVLNPRVWRLGVRLSWR